MVVARDGPATESPFRTPCEQKWCIREGGTTASDRGTTAGDKTDPCSPQAAEAGFSLAPCAAALKPTDRAVRW